jgi:hypothetical protein
MAVGRGDAQFAILSRVCAAIGAIVPYSIFQSSMSKSLDEAQSRELAQAASCRAKAPFDNAYAAIVQVADAVYVQGFLAVPGEPNRPIEHAWLEVGEMILDPTFPWLNKKAENLYYFPAQTLTLKRLKLAIEEAQEDYPEDDPLPIYGSQPYDYYGDLMLGGPEYTAAFAAAQAKCRELNAVKPKSKS